MAEAACLIASAVTAQIYDEIFVLSTDVAALERPTIMAGRYEIHTGIFLTVEDDVILLCL